MMKMKKLIIMMLVCIMTVSSLHIPAFAEDGTSSEIQPYLSDIYTCSVNFTISSSGLATAYYTYEGDPDVFESVTSEIYLEKRFLLVFWTRVDIGVTDDVWTDTLYDDNGYKVHTIQLEDTGTYRAKFKLTFTGTNTTDDVIEKTIQATY